MGCVTEQNFSRAIADARAELDAAEVASPDLETVEHLRAAARHVDDALNEVMATLVVDGASLRSVAAAAGMAPNSVRPRLATAPTLAPYAADGVVDSMGVAAARLEQRQPMRFTRRRPTQEEK